MFAHTTRRWALGSIVLVTAVALGGRARAEGGEGEKNPYFTGWAATRSEMAAATPTGRPSGHIALWSVNGLGAVDVDIYNRDGSFNTESLAALDNLLHCMRTGRVKPVDPHLYELVSRVDDHFGGRRLDLISGFRNQPNHESKHYKGEAIDFHVPGVADRELRDYIDSLDTGGMGVGLYPNAGFVHMDLRPTETSFRWIDRSGHKYDAWVGAPPAPKTARVAVPGRRRNRRVAMPVLTATRR